MFYSSLARVTLVVSAMLRLQRSYSCCVWNAQVTKKLLLLCLQCSGYKEVTLVVSAMLRLQRSYSCCVCNAQVTKKLLLLYLQCSGYKEVTLVVSAMLRLQRSWRPARVGKRRGARMLSRSWRWPPSPWSGRSGNEQSWRSHLDKQLSGQIGQMADARKHADDMNRTFIKRLDELEKHFAGLVAEMEKSRDTLRQDLKAELGKMKEAVVVLWARSLLLVNLWYQLRVQN